MPELNGLKGDQGQSRKTVDESWEYSIGLYVSLHFAF